MSMPRLFLLSLGVGAAVAFVAMVSVDVILPWNDYINVLDAPQSELSQLSENELHDRLLKGTIALEALNGMKKVYYILAHRPQYFAFQWMYFFIPSVVAAFLGGLLGRSRHGA